MNKFYITLLSVLTLGIAAKATVVLEGDRSSYLAPALMAPGGPPANDLCTAITPVALSLGSTITFTGDNTDATFAGDAETGTVLDQFPFPNTWHAFTTTECASVTISYCNTSDGWDNVWRLLSTACPADNNTINATSYETTTCANGNQTLFFSQLPAGTYYYPVLNDGFLSRGAYSIEVTAADCGTGLPVNDLCSTVTPEALAVGGSLVFTGTTLNATLDGDAEPGTTLDQVGLPSVWHAVVLSECANLMLSYCGTTPTWSNVWHLISRSCPATDDLVNATSFNTTDCGDGNQTVFFAALEAGTYYIPVLNDQFNTIGPYTLTASATDCGTGVPVNDLCSSVTPTDIAAGETVTFTGTTANATLDGDAEPGTTLDQVGLASVWHAITLSDCANITIEYCGTAPVWPNVWHLLARSCPATNDLVNATGFNTDDCLDGNQSVFFAALPAGTYYIPVLNDAFNSIGPYTINVVATDCGTGVPSNDLCSSVTPETLAMGGSVTFNGDNTNATLAGDAEAGTVIDNGGLPCVWHAFTIAECADITVSYCGTDPVFGNVYNLMATSCPATDDLVYATSFNNTDCVDGNRSIFYDDVAAGTYYVPVLNDLFATIGAYTLTISAYQCDSTSCDGGLVNANGETALTICKDGNADPLVLASNTNSAESYTYLLTDDAENIISVLAGNSLDANDLALGSYHAWGVSYNGDLTGADVGAPASEVASTGSCFDLSSNFVAIEVEICSGMSELTSEELSIYPNPTTGGLNILSRTSEGSAHVLLIDVTGRTVFAQRVQLQQGVPQALGTEGVLAPGSYVLRLSDALGSMERRVIVR